MKATKLFNGSKAIVAFLIFTILAICSCKKEPDPVKPRDLVKPISTVNVASKVTTVSATISGTVEPGEIGTKIYVEFCESNMAWQSVYFFTTVDTKTVNVSFDLLNLKPQTVYNYRITAQNAATTQLEPSPTKTFTTCTLPDLDGTYYHSVKIGTQEWIVENWSCTKYNDGTAIPNVTDATAWTKLTTGAYCNQNNDPNTVSTYGRMYNWFAVGSGKLAPAGWHVATYNDLEILHTYLGVNTAGGKIKEAGFAHWLTPNNGATNESGFTALPGGYRNETTGSFLDIGKSGIFWTSTSFDNQSAWLLSLDYMAPQFVEGGLSKITGLPIRLIRN